MTHPIDQSNRTRFASELHRNSSVVASAGSGKTRAITDRIVRVGLSKDALEHLPQLVVVTFTNRAADEMQQRARARMLEAGVSLEVLTAFNRAYFGTIHSFCLKLLANHGHHLGLPSKLDSITQDDDELWNEFVQRQTTVGVSLTPENRAALLRHVQVRALMELGRRCRTPGSVPLPTDACPGADFSAVYAFAARRASKTIPDVQERLKRWEQSWLSGKDFLPWPECNATTKEFVATWREAFAPIRNWINKASLCVAAEVQRNYREFRLDRGAVTFDDQIALACELMHHSEAATRIREKNYRVILDEAQDTDPQQFSALLEITRPIGASGDWLDSQKDPPRPGHFCMVGDFQQAIYRDRADLSHYRRLHDALISSGAAEAVTFSVTFRLDREQIAFVNETFRSILNNLEGQVPFVELNPRPEILPGQIVRLEFSAEKIVRDASGKIPDRQAAAHEAKQIAQWLRATGLRKLRARSWRDVAILCPRKAWLRVMREALWQEGFSIQIQSESELKGDSPAHAWLTALLTIMAEPALGYEIVGVLREVFGISDHDLAVFSGGEGKRFQIARLTSESGPVANALDSLVSTRLRIVALPLFSLVEELVAAVQLRARLQSLPRTDLAAVETELDGLLATAAEAEANGETLAQFAEKLRDDFDRARDVQPGDQDSIQLITSQKAKGSEWDAVIVPFLSRRVYPGPTEYPRLIKDPRSGELVVALDKDDVAPGLKLALAASARHEMERLLYVALTRSKHTLVLAFDAPLFETASGELEKSSQLRWLDGGERFLDLPLKISACTKTASFQQEEISRVLADESVAELPPMSADVTKLAATSASVFVRKYNPSGMGGETPSPSGLSADGLKELEPELRPSKLDNPATLYGSWWHELAERLPWSAGESERQIVFEQRLKFSPDRERSCAEWELFQKHLASAADFRRQLKFEGAIAQAEYPFAWKFEDAACLEGIIDLALFDPDSRRCLILDWKTNRVTPEEAPGLRERYLPQIAAYSQAVAALTGLAVSAGIYSTAVGLFFPYDSLALEREWERLRNVPLERFSADIAV